MAFIDGKIISLFVNEAIAAVVVVVLLECSFVFSSSIHEVFKCLTARLANYYYHNNVNQSNNFFVLTKNFFFFELNSKIEQITEPLIYDTNEF